MFPPHKGEGDLPANTSLQARSRIFDISHHPNPSSPAKTGAQEIYPRPEAVKLDPGLRRGSHRGMGGESACHPNLDKAPKTLIPAHHPSGILSRSLRQRRGTVRGAAAAGVRTGCRKVDSLHLALPPGFGSWGKPGGAWAYGLSVT
ncbi:hypothetical protein GCM10011321_24830 [Youhaiella tibetensis]|nr:hypothetical protein GCM10011321_24830 [Youhaiella tibetensis]